MLNQKQKIIAILVIAIVIIVIAYYYINSTKDVYTDMATGNIMEETIEESEDTNETSKKQIIKIHVTGAVKTNGVVEIEKDGRVNDAIEAAGGITEDADLSDINLAYKIEDGQKIYIPSIDDKEEKTQTQEQDQTQEQGFSRQKQEVTFIIPGNNNEEEQNSSKININKATFTELITLPGIGEATAVKILEYRKTNGNFQNIEQIKNVSGIGEAKFNVIKEYITV